MRIPSGERCQVPFFLISAYGSEPWVSKAVAQSGLENTIRNPWRPEKGT
jgi:hypothetical protein